MLIERIERELEEAKRPPLSWYDGLFALSFTPDHRLRMHERADTIVLSRSNLTRLVDRLEAKGLLYRKSCPNDRRGAYAVLTPEGLEMQQRMWPVYEGAITKYFSSHLNDKEKQALAEILERILTSTHKEHGRDS